MPKKSKAIAEELPQKTSWERFLKFVSNGGKAQVTAGLVALVALIIFVAQLISNINMGAYAPLSNYEDPFIASYVNGRLTVDTVFCAADDGDGDSKIRITSNAALLIVEQNDTSSVISAATLPFDKKLGCDHLLRTFVVSISLPPAQYKVIGTDTVTNGSHIQQQDWESIVFQVE